MDAYGCVILTIMVLLFRAARSSLAASFGIQAEITDGANLCGIQAGWDDWNVQWRRYVFGVDWSNLVVVSLAVTLFIQKRLKEEEVHTTYPFRRLAQQASQAMFLVMPAMRDMNPQ